ncbi:MAG: hypothetical protein IJV94_04615 [Bacilli bacterium]|nr:hypothetical protein [Bacilli bacterium]
MEYRIDDNNDRILIQNLGIVKLLEVLHNNDFIYSDYFKALKCDDYYKKIISSMGINNTSCLLLMLFLLLNQLVELNKKKKEMDLRELEIFIRSRIRFIYSDTESFAFDCNYIDFIRNSIAHYNTRFEFKNDKVEVFFTSKISVKIQGIKNKQKRLITFSLYSEDVGAIIDETFKISLLYLDKKYKNKENKE